MKTAFLVDVHNLYMAINRKFPGKVLNYIKVLEELKAANYDIFHKVAYGRQPEEQVKPFASMLRKNGFEVHFGNTPHNMEMAIKAVDVIHNSNIQCVVIGTNYFEAGRILRYARDKGINTMSFGVGLPEFFQTLGQTWEVTEDLLSDKKPKDESIQVATPEQVAELAPTQAA